MTTTEKCSCGSDATCSEWKEADVLPPGVLKLRSRLVVCSACGKGAIERQVQTEAPAEFIAITGTVSA